MLRRRQALVAPARPELRRAASRLFSAATRTSASIRPCEYGLIFRRLSAKNALPVPAGLFQRDTPHGGLCICLDLRFAIRAAAPIRPREAPLDGGFEFAIILRFEGVRLTRLQSAVIKRLLNFGEQLRNSVCDSSLRHKRLPFLARSCRAAPARRCLSPRPWAPAQCAAARRAFPNH